MKRRVASICKWVGYAWLWIGTGLILIGSVSYIFLPFEGVGASLIKFWDLLSPFNIGHWLLIALTLAPGIGLLIAHDHLLKHNT